MLTNHVKALVGAFSMIVKLCVIFGNFCLKLYAADTRHCTTDL